MMLRGLTIALLSLMLLASAGCAIVRVEPFNLENPTVKPGVEVLFDEPEFLNLVRGKRVGLITNPTGVDSKLRSTVDLLHEHPEIELVALFGPEHGVRGQYFAGDHVEDAPDPKTGIPAYSLYGKTRRAKPEWLENVDVLVYDIQDIGSRSYTFIYTMAYAMESAAEHGIPFVVLDRPNPIGGHIVDGNILNTDEYKTFVGLYPIAYQYGMTAGEAARMFNKEYNTAECELHVVPMRGYRRDMMYWETGLPWVLPSQHIPQWQHAAYYNLTGIIGEIREVNIGVGYTTPFETIAAPWINADEFADALNAKKLPGLLFRPISYTPRYNNYVGELINGVHITITDYHKVRPVTAQIHSMETIQRLYPEVGMFTDEKAQRWLFDEVNGTLSIRTQILEGKTADEIVAGYQNDVNEWLRVREKYLIYK
jgi:uncharacterized protein YbbC (DUF1343 family)